MKRAFQVAALVAILAVQTVGTAEAQASGRVGIRVGVGTDISGGIAYGGQIGYTLPRDGAAIELALALFGGSFSEESNNGFNDYFEETDVLAGGAMFNYLLGYGANPTGPYIVAGAGVGAFSVEWREESPTDTSLGPALPGGGSYQEEDGAAGGVILNFGVGQRFSDRVDLRAQVPTFFINAGDQRDGMVIPTFTVTLGIAF